MDIKSEMLVRTEDRLGGTAPERNTKAGDVIAVKAFPAKWGRKEIESSIWRVVQTDMAFSDAEKYLEPLESIADGIVSARSKGFDLAMLNEDSNYYTAEELSAATVERG